MARNRRKTTNKKGRTAAVAVPLVLAGVDGAAVAGVASSGGEKVNGALTAPAAVAVGAGDADGKLNEKDGLARPKVIDVESAPVDAGAVPNLIGAAENCPHDESVPFLILQNSSI